MNTVFLAAKNVLSRFKFACLILTEWPRLTKQAISLYIFIALFTYSILLFSQTVEELYQSAIDNIQSDRPEEGYNLLQQLLTTQPGSTLTKEAEYWSARAMEKMQQPEKALTHYRNYSRGNHSSVYQLDTRFKKRLIEEALARDAVMPLNVYLRALDARSKGRAKSAISIAQELTQRYASSHLADDAMHLMAYIQLMDRNDYSAAVQLYKHLLQSFPQSNYQDNARYSLGIAYEHQGQFPLAREALEQLKKKHTSFSLRILNVALPKDSYLSRLWFNKAEKRLHMLERKELLTNRSEQLLATRPFAFGMGGRLLVDQPVGGYQNYRSVWNLLGEHELKVSYLTSWITRNTDWRWQSKQRYMAAARHGFTPVVSYWYFGDEISPEFVTQHRDEYFRDIENHLIPLIKDLPEVIVLLEPEFNKNTIPSWPGWGKIATEAIIRIKEAVPGAKVGLTLGDWGNYDIEDTVSNIKDAVKVSDFVGFMAMVSSSHERPMLDPSWSLIERSNRFISYLKETFDKPLFMGYLAISTAGGWEEKQAIYINDFMKNIPYYIDQGVMGAGFFALFDNPEQKGWFAKEEKQFGLLTSDGREKPGMKAWLDGVDKIIRSDTSTPHIINLQITPDPAQDLSNRPVSIAVEFNEWTKWRLSFVGENSGASYSITGAGKSAHLKWDGLAKKGTFIDEICMLQLEAKDKSGNPLLVHQQSFQIKNPKQFLLHSAFELMLDKTITPWSRQTELTQKHDLLEVGVEIEQSIHVGFTQAEEGFDIALRAAKIGQDAFFDRKQKMIEITIRLQTSVEGLLIGLVDQSGVRSEVLIEAYLDPGVIAGSWQTIQIPLEDFPDLGRYYDSQGQLVWEKTSWNSMEKMIFHTITLPMKFEISGINFKYIVFSSHDSS